MKTSHFLFILFIFSGFSLYAAKKPDAKSVRVQDLSSANTTEASADFTSVEKGKAFVRMFHNDENIKVQILVPDQSMQIKFFMQGLNVYLDISGKKSKKICVQFPKSERPQMQRNMQQPPQREPSQQGAVRQERPAMDVTRMIASLNAKNAVLVNKKNKSSLDAENVNIQQFEESKILFTIYLPLSSLGDKIGKEKIISVGLSSEMEVPQGMPPGGGMGGPPGGGQRGGGGGMGGPDGGEGGMRPGGGMGGPGGGGPRPMGGGGAFAEMSTPFNAWITFGVD